MPARALPLPAPRTTWAALALLTALAWPLVSRAEAPMVTDDAGTLDKGGTKVELTWERSGQVRGPSLALAYAPIDHLEAEIALASAHDRSTDPASPSHARGLALKWVPFSWGATSAGFKFETSRATLSGSGSERDTQVQALLTHNYASGVVLHANLGRDRSKDPTGNTSHATTWALGGELPLAASVKLVADVYGDSHSTPGHQIGVRWTLKEGLKLSAAVGRLSHESNVLSVLTWEF